MKPVELKGVVIENKKLASDIIKISIKIDEELVFKAGQYVMIKVQNGSDSKWRAYSILNPPSKKGKIDLCIKIIDKGFASEVFRKTKIGDEFKIKGPFGGFFFDENDSNDEFWLIGVGTGIVPLYSVVKEHLLSNKDKKFKVFFGARTRNDLVFHEEFLELEKNNENFEYLVTITREKWDGNTGRVQKHLNGNLKNKTFYICGLKEMIFETKDYLLGKRVDSENIKFERYS
jgi:NAD(P)H-flavin reductase|tara:strand:+ start:1653 stop:2345 length:693 start_codon:yes stop_codon:yes gene_type:complete